MSQEPCQPGPAFSPEQYPLLDEVQRRGGIKHLRIEQLEQLASELRRSLIEVVQFTGGHLASNLGTVELTIALHYVFDSPRDAFLWDVGHQAYVHKMLTGRWRDFRTLRQRGGLSGFLRRDESPHDYLNAGHAGTAISAALGLELGRSLDCGLDRKLEQKDRSPDQVAEERPTNSAAKVLCVVGDASLTSGMAFEAMNHCGHQANRLVVVLNDNEMSIAPNVGAVSRILSRLTAGHSYVFIRDHINQFIRRIPLLGDAVYAGLLRIKGAIKKAFYRTNLFTEFGFKYIGPINGHNIKLLVDTLQRIALLNEPAFLHVSTQKGKGLKEAEEAPTKYHGVTPKVVPSASAQNSSSARSPATSQAGSVTQTQPKSKSPLTSAGTFTQCFSAALLELEGSFPQLVCISAAMAGSTGLQPFAERHPERFFDVGIAEQHALTLACGLALTGKLPLVAIYSTFMQRAMDQLIHDISLMRLPVIFVCDRAGIVPGDGDTHQGIYDITQFRSIIGLRLYSPATKQQLQACLEEAMRRGQREIAQWQERCRQGRHDFQGAPVVLRLPKRNCPDIAGDCSTILQFFAGPEAPENTDSRVGTYRILLFCTGSLLPEALQAQQLAANQAEDGICLRVDVLQLCQLTPLPLQQLNQYWEAENYSVFFCAEDGVIQGGVGEEILRQLMAFQLRRQKLVSVHLRGVEFEVPQLGNYLQLLRDYGLDAESLLDWMVSEVDKLAL